MTRQEKVKFINDFGYVIHDCNNNNIKPNDDTNIYYLSDADLDAIYNDCIMEQMEENNETEAITIKLSFEAINFADAIIKAKGGYREKAILNAEHTYSKTCDWNKEHRVVKLTTIDGKSCEVDLQTMQIVG